MISLENIDKFKLLYNDAVSKNKEMFVFEGRDVLTSYGTNMLLNILITYLMSMVE